MDFRGPGTDFFRKYLTVAAVSSLVLITVIAVAEHAIIRRSLIDEAQHHAEELAEGLSLCELSEIMANSHQAGTLLVTAEEAAELDKELSEFLEPFSILSIRLVNRDGRVVFATDAGEIGKTSHRGGGLDEALSGQTAVQFKNHSNTTDLADHEHSDLAIVETYLPLPGEDGAILGAFELYTNVQTHLESGRATWFTLVVSVSALVLVAFTVLSLLVKRLCNRMDLAARTELNNNAELARSEKFLQQVMDSIPDDLLVIGADHKVLLANKHVREKFGSDPVGRNMSCYEIFRDRNEPCSDESESCPMREAAQTKSQASAVHRHTDKQGESIHVEVVTVPIFDSDGHPVQFIEHCRDISDRMHHEEEISAANQELQETNKRLIAAEAEAKTQASFAIKADEAKSVFLANMSHEMRTPLTAIMGYADLINDPGTSVAEASKNLAVIQRNGEQLLALIEDILDLAKVEEGQMALRLAGCDTLAFVAEIESLVRPRSADTGLSFGVKYLTAVPKMVFTDQTRLKQALLNLLFNAFKFTSKGNIGLEVEFVDQSQGQDPTLRFHVTDTGIGITEEVRRSLFQPFTQGDDHYNRRFGGTGLGLTITKRIGEVLGGGVSVKSTPGSGSRFTLTIGTGDVQEQPLVTPAINREAKVVAPAKLANSAVDLAGLKILYAEDMADNQFLVGTILRKAGAQVDIAENGVIAVEKSGATEYDMILMDIQMPEMDGLEATRIIREGGYDRPIVALTANAMANDRRLSAQAGCDEHLTKPVNRRKLLAAVQAHCQSGVRT